MNCIESMISVHPGRLLSSALVAGALAVTAPLFADQPCIEFGGDFWDGSNCLVDPGMGFAKAYTMQRFTFQGAPILAVDMGDEIQLFRLSDAAAPATSGWSEFHMPHLGEADHLMYQFSVGDEARYVFSVHETGIAIADLGTNSTPSFVATTRWLRDDAHPEADELGYTPSNVGGMVFEHDGNTYLLTHMFDDSCGESAALYRLSTDSQGTVQRSLTQCVALPLETGAIGIQGGRKWNDILFVATNKSSSAAERRNVAIYRIGPGPSLSLLAKDLFVGSLLRVNGFDLDHQAGLIAAANPDLTELEVEIWAAGFHGQGSWSDPVYLASIPVPRNTQVMPPLAGPHSVALAWPLLWIDGGGLYDISDPLNAVQLVAPLEYFHPSVPGPQNTFEFCLDRNWVAGIFHPDRTTLYLPRFPVAQVDDVVRCVALFADGFESGDMSWWSTVTNGE